MRLFLAQSGCNVVIVRAETIDEARTAAARLELERFVKNEDEEEMELNESYFVDGWEAIEIPADGDPGVLLSWWSSTHWSGPLH
jgi:hypothetical protein